MMIWPEKCCTSTAAINSAGSPDTWVTQDEDIP